MTRHVWALAALLACAACASSPNQETGPAAARTASVDPVGTFDFTTTVEGTDVTGSIVIARAATGGYTGSITTNVTDPIPVTGVTVEGQTLHVTAESPDGQVTFTMVFTGNDFTGNWSIGGGQMSGVASGRRRVS